MLAKVLWPLFAALSLASCSASQVPCVTPNSCSAGQECLANRCVAEGFDPVAPQTERLVLHPARLGVSPGAHSIPTSASLGGPTSRQQSLFLDFELGALHTAASSNPERGTSAQHGTSKHPITAPNPPKGSKLTLEAAFLLLPPRDAAEPLAHPVELRARPLATTWDPAAVSEGRLPRGGQGTALGLAHGRALVRIDVTQLLKTPFEESQRFFGFVIRGDAASAPRPPETALPQPFIAATGTADGRGPTLELYITRGNTNE
jgi:hypothetical protein